MSWTMEKFEADGVSVWLPLGRPEEDVDTGLAARTYHTSALGGVIDSSGLEQAWPGVLEISRRGAFIGANQAEVQEQLEALMAMHGKVGKLYRRSTSSNDWQWTDAALKRVVAPFSPANVLHLIVDTTFERISRQWFGHERSFDTIDLLSNDDDFAAIGVDDNDIDGTTVFTLHNGGNAATNQVVLTIEATVSDITQVTVVGDMSQFVWDDTLYTGQSLRVESGREKSVTRRVELTGPVAAGATTLPVAHSGGFVAGQRVDLIHKALGITTQRIVNNVPNATNIVLTSGAGHALQAGDEVVGGAYANAFALDTSRHLVSDWFRIEPGLNTLTVFLVPDVEALIRFTYNDGWK
jgi:hypothetical protein